MINYYDISLSASRTSPLSLTILNDVRLFETEAGYLHYSLILELGEGQSVIAESFLGTSNRKARSKCLLEALFGIRIYCSNVIWPG